MPKKIKYLILGAGPCGLGAGYRLKDLGIEDYLILEKSNRVGGLATSYIDEKGFTWDIGGHVQFSHYDYFDQAMEKALGKNGWLHHEREAWVWLKNTFVPYPFQNNIHRLPNEDTQSCLRGMEKIKESEIKINNFKDWLLKSFGQGLCDVFMYPYNFKVWAHKPEELNYSWVGERVAQIDLERIKKNIELNQDDVSWGPNNTFQFPLKGGTGAIWNAIGKEVGLDKVLLNSAAEKIDWENKTVFSNGQAFEYEHLISSLPLTTTTKLINDPALIKLANELKYSSTHVVGIGIKGELPKQLDGKCWMYFPEDDSPFYRVTVFSNYSPHNVPDPECQFSLMAEISESNQKPVNEETIVENTIQGLKNSKLIHDEEIISKWSFKAALGYPTPSLNRDDVLKSLLPNLESKGIYSRGRFGAWMYEISNQDHTFMQGVEWVNKMVQGQNEETFKLS